MRTRNGKIARLPHPIREQLNVRLECSEPSPSLLTWLNALPEVQELQSKEFDGQPVSKQNLAAWHHGGFQEWLTRRELMDQARNAGEFGEEIDGEQDVLVDNVAKVMAARYAALLLQWDGTADESFKGKARILNGICRALVRLQRGMHLARKEHAELERKAQQEAEEQAEKIRQKKLQKILSIPASRTFAKAFGGGDLGEQAANVIYAIQNDIPLEKMAEAMSARPEAPNGPKKRDKPVNKAGDSLANSAPPADPVETSPVKAGQGDYPSKCGENGGGKPLALSPVEALS